LEVLTLVFNQGQVIGNLLLDLFAFVKFMDIVHQIWFPYILLVQKYCYEEGQPKQEDRQVTREVNVDNHARQYQHYAGPQKYSIQ
jgi:lantibiotic modifying enzyme